MAVMRTAYRNQLGKSEEIQSKVQDVYDSIISKHLLRHSMSGGTTGFICLRQDPVGTSSKHNKPPGFIKDGESLDQLCCLRTLPQEVT
jgi:hypothetical protein